MRRASSDIDRLIADLQSPDSIRRDAAVARLRILGGRALPRLVDLAATHESAPVRAIALDTLEGLHDVRVIDAAVDALRDGSLDVVVAALGVLREWVTEETGTRLLDAITAIAVDRRRDARVRVAALAALSGLPEHLVRPIREQAPPAESAGPSLDDPGAVREWIQAYGANAPLSAMHGLVTRAGEREHAESSSRLRSEWRLARGQAHLALARRRSRIALYDIRETFEAATEPLPPAFLSAVSAIGDTSCLEPLARAWTAAGKNLTWKHDLSTTAAAIMRREKLTGRSAVVKKLRANHPGFA